MMDPDTITVGYRDWRGEPRGKHRKGAAVAATSRAATAYVVPDDAPEPAAQGDCIDCMACVNVCPMGIDIRDGQQLECITCALCIDACDDVMAKIGKPRGLIDYMALSDEPAERAGVAPRPIWQHILRPRTILYTALWSLIGVGLVWALFVRSDIGLTVEPVRNPTFVTLSDGSVRNTYTVRLRNMSGEDRQFRLMLTSDDILRLELEGEEQGTTVTVPAQEALQQRVYITARADDPAANRDRTDLRIWVEDVDSGSRAGRETTFNGKAE
jgi:cytochrome c oxidase accessory protein FixG